ncbi:relaxase/mobilization nuclease domain-containing protein [Parabacteroides timonensis]|uniref:relaxase/mobilization nuclease domain-containing protein n=1 Tax=Parabacteroides timonensis TaxID=1871013 RepID=UPI00094EA47C|nr:relaxase/mobilization nuclease domain-containing protein [Parabacteroides timonensis]
MIAEIQPSFSSHLSMSRKIEYQLFKVKEGNGKVLCTSTGDELAAMPAYMKLISQLNDRVKLPYTEFILSLYPGESLSDEQWLSLTGEYIEGMGYGKSCYAVVLNTDKAHSHVHVLLTTIDEEGKSIPSGNNYSRSEKISRALEQKYGLLPLVKENSRKTTLGESQYRNYYFYAALKKAMRSYSYKDKVSAVLKQSDTYQSLDKPLQEIKLANEEWRVLLGDENYDDLFVLLEKGGFFKPLFKDELLQQLDRIYSFSESTSDFRRNLEQEGLYMRLVTKKDKSYYVYGIKDSGFYLKDASLPQKYRFGNIRFDGRGMSADEQMHYLYDHVFRALNASSGYEVFKKNLADESIRVTEHVNGKGAYGISFYMENVEDPHIFKGVDLSRQLTYQNIQRHFDGAAVGLSPHIDRVGEFRERVDREAFYMQGGGVTSIPEFDITGSGKKSQEDDFMPSKKKRKRKSGPDFSL